MRKKIRAKGKLKLSRMFQQLKEGDRVAVVRELAEKASFPKVLQGRSGTIESKKGRAYIVKIRQGKGEKRFIIKPIHLKKLK